MFFLCWSDDPDGAEAMDTTRKYAIVRSDLTEVHYAHGLIEASELHDELRAAGGIWHVYGPMVKLPAGVNKGRKVADRTVTVNRGVDVAELDADSHPCPDLSQSVACV